jgi:uncharacterized protein (TIGR02001 family)
MRKSLLTLAVLGAIAAPTLAFAEEAKPDYTIAYNIGLYSSYQFRGLEQTGGRPALQGGVDFTHSSGFYLGTWGSNISWLEENQTYKKSSLEIDVYGGYKNTIGDTGIGYDVGLLGYYYPGDKVDTAAYTPRADTVEVKAGLSYSYLSATAWYIATKNGLGTTDAQGSFYLDLTATYPIADTGISAIAHVGRQEFRGNAGANDPFSYTDYKLGATKAWDNGVALGGYYTNTSVANTTLYTYQGENWAKDKFTFFVSKTF